MKGQNLVSGKNKKISMSHLLNLPRERGKRLNIMELTCSVSISDELRSSSKYPEILTCSI